MVYHLNAAERVAVFRKKVDEDFATLIRDVSDIGMAEADRMAVVNHINAARAAFNQSFTTTLPEPVKPTTPIKPL